MSEPRPSDPLRFPIPTSDEIASIVAGNHGTSVLDVAEVKVQGGVNHTFLATTPDRRLIVRVNEAAELRRFQKEAWAIQHAAAVDVPVPEVAAVGVAAELAYMIESYVEGPSGNSLPPDGQRSAWREIGGLLKRIHSVPVGGFGEELSDLTEGGSANWARYLDYNLGALNDRDPLVEMGVLEPKTQGRLRASFEGLRDIPKTFGLSHGDMSLRNVISHEGRLHVIDWGEANAHFVPHFDFGIILEDSLDAESSEFVELLAGYGLDRPGFQLLKPYVEALRLLIRTDKVRWALERRPERLAGRARDLVRFMNRIGWAAS